MIDKNNSPTSNNLNSFLYPHYPYRGEFKPEYLVFNANLQEFSCRVSYICNLQTGGKISSEAAYKQLKTLWKNLKDTRKNLNF